jgi:hypothetical protein
MAAVIKLMIVDALSIGLRPITAVRHCPLTPGTVRVIDTFKRGVPRNKWQYLPGSQREGPRAPRRAVPDAQDEVAGDGEAPRAEPGMDVDLTGAIHQELPPGDDGGTVPWWLAQRR